MIAQATRFWLVRHAPVDVAPGVIVGSLDLPCLPIAPEAVAMLVRRLPEVSVLVESGLFRCRQTSEALRKAGAKLPQIPLIEPGLLEQNLGGWQGGRWDDPAMHADAEVDAFWDDPATTRPPGGESFADVMERVRPVLQRLSMTYAGRDVVMVMHAGSIRAALAVALDLAPDVALRFAVDPLSLSRLSAFVDGWRVDEVNGI